MEKLEEDEIRVMRDGRSMGTTVVLPDGREQEFSNFVLPAELQKLGVDPIHIQQAAGLGADEYIDLQGNQALIEQAAGLGWIAPPEAVDWDSPEFDDSNVPYVEDDAPVVTDNIIKDGHPEVDSFDEDAPSITISREGRSMSYDVTFEDGTSISVSGVALQTTLSQMGVPDDQIEMVGSLPATHDNSIEVNADAAGIETFQDINRLGIEQPESSGLSRGLTAPEDDGSQFTSRGLGLGQ